MRLWTRIDRKGIPKKLIPQGLLNIISDIKEAGSQALQESLEPMPEHEIIQEKTIINGKPYTYLTSGHENSPYAIIHIHGLIGSMHNFAQQLADDKFSAIQQISPNWLLDLWKEWDEGKKKEFLEASDPIDYVVDSYFGDLIQDIAPRHIILDGVSLGWEIAYRLAAKYPDKIKGIVLSGASGLGVEKWPGNIFDYTNNEANLQTAIKGHFVNPETLDIEELQMLTESIKHLIGKEFRQVMTKLGRAARQPDITKNTQALETIRNNNTPVALFHGEKDDIVPIETLGRFQEVLNVHEENIHLFDANHMPNMDGSAQAYTDELKRFTNRILMKYK